MKTHILHVLAAASVLAAAATAQVNLGAQPPFQGHEITGLAQAVNELRITHDVPPAIPETGSLPAGTRFGDNPVGPKCPHWPANGAGTAFSLVRGADGLSYTYRGVELIQLSRGETGTTGPHDNAVVFSARSCVNGYLDVYVKSLVDSEAHAEYARVEVHGYQIIKHSFVAQPGKLWAETRETLPVMVGPAGLEVHAKTRITVDNQTQPTFQGLVHLEVAVRFRLPEAQYRAWSTGCGGSNGVPEIQAAPGELPVLGTAFDVAVSNLPLDPTKGAYGLFAGARLVPPLDLGLIGMPTCDLHVYPLVVFPLVKVNGQATWTLNVPFDVGLAGVQFYQQVFALDASWVNALGAVVSNYGEGTFGTVPLPPLQ